MSENHNTIEFKLKEKLDAGEISQNEYDELYQKFLKLDILQTTVKSPKQSSNWSFKGSNTTEGGTVKGPVISSGKLSLTSNLKCQRLSISGSIDIHGELTVLGKTSANGNILVDGIAKFGGPVALTGVMTVFDNLYSTESMTISGRLTTDGNINSGGPLKISGGLSCENIKSSSSVRLSGKINVKEDFIAKSVDLSKVNAHIGNNLKAEVINISQEYSSKKSFEKKLDELDDIDGIPDIAKFVAKMVTDFVPNVVSGLTNIFTEKSVDKVEIGGTLEGREIDISYTQVNRDIIGDSVKIGPGVIVGGIVKYKKHVELPEGSEIITEKLEG